MNRYKSSKGWRNESTRHSLARKGIKTKFKKQSLAYKKIYDNMLEKKKSNPLKEEFKNLSPKARKFYVELGGRYKEYWGRKVDYAKITDREKKIIEREAEFISKRYRIDKVIALMIADTHYMTYNEYKSNVPLLNFADTLSKIISKNTDVFYGNNKNSKEGFEILEKNNPEVLDLLKDNNIKVFPVDSIVLWVSDIKNKRDYAGTVDGWYLINDNAILVDRDREPEKIANIIRHESVHFQQHKKEDEKYKPRDDGWKFVAGEGFLPSESHEIEAGQ